MSLLNGKVEASHYVIFNTYQEACIFINTLRPDSFEGIQVRKYGYIVNYFIQKLNRRI